MNEDYQKVLEELSGNIEAILFVHGEPMQTEALMKIINETPGADKKITSFTVESALTFLDQRLRNTKSGLALVRGEGSVQLATSPHAKKFIEHVVKMEMNEELTPASLETLAIIAYSGPITRSGIDYVRGVNSSFILRALLIRGLIDRAPQPERVNTYEYTPSMLLLKHLGIAQKESLPEYLEFQEVVKAIKLTPPH